MMKYNERAKRLEPKRGVSIRTLDEYGEFYGIWRRRAKDFGDTCTVF